MITFNLFFREASDVKPKKKHGMVATDVNDLLKSQAVIVTYKESAQNITASLASVLKKTTADFTVHSVQYFQVC